MFSPKYADVFFILPDKLKRQPYRVATALSFKLR